MAMDLISCKNSINAQWALFSPERGTSMLETCFIKNSLDVIRVGYGTINVASRLRLRIVIFGQEFGPNFIALGRWAIKHPKEPWAPILCWTPPWWMTTIFKFSVPVRVNAKKLRTLWHAVNFRWFTNPLHWTKNTSINHCHGYNYSRQHSISPFPSIFRRYAAQEHKKFMSFLCMDRVWFLEAPRLTHHDLVHARGLHSRDVKMQLIIQPRTSNNSQTSR